MSVDMETFLREEYERKNKRFCGNCHLRKSYAKLFDAHFDWRDCPYECEYADEMEKKARMTE